MKYTIIERAGKWYPALKQAGKVIGTSGPGHKDAKEAVAEMHRLQRMQDAERIKDADATEKQA
jgi:hypothetical protein